VDHGEWVAYPPQRPPPDPPFGYRLNPDARDVATDSLTGRTAHFDAVHIRWVEEPPQFFVVAENNPGFATNPMTGETAHLDDRGSWAVTISTDTSAS
jgi:hypothetical protein